MKYFFRSILKCYYKILFRIKVHDLDKLPKEGAYLLCSNHLNAQDPLIIGISMKRFLAFMAKKELFQTKFTNWFFRVNGGFPVDRDANDISAVKTSIRILKSGTPMLMFPEGTRNNTKIPLEAKPGVAMIAIRAKVPVVPLTISGSFKLFKTIHLTVGDTIYLDEYYGERLNSATYQKVTQDIVNKIYEKME